MYILGIESSCDETAASIVKDGRQIVSNIVYSQVEEPGLTVVWCLKLHHADI